MSTNKEDLHNEKTTHEPAHPKGQKEPPRFIAKRCVIVNAGPLESIKQPHKHHLNTVLQEFHQVVSFLCENEALKERNLEGAPYHYFFATSRVVHHVTVLEHKRSGGTAVHGSAFVECINDRYPYISIK